MHREHLPPPNCPVCENPGQRNRHLTGVLGPWVCDGCALFFYGTTAEFDHYLPHRERRKALREKADG